METNFFDLPLIVQLALGSGYAAYMLAYVGIRSHHKTVDVAFLTMMFGLASVGIYYFMPSSVSRPVTVALAVFAALLFGIIWRLFTPVVRDWFRETGYSWADDDPSVWSSFKRNTRDVMSQLSVELDDGTRLYCDDLSAFKDAPFGPCCLGDNGDVALYVTSRRLTDGSVSQQKGVTDAAWGDRITWVPASRVRKIEMRYISGKLITRG